MNSALPKKPLLAYATNVHPSETLRDIYRFLRDYTIPVRNRVFGRESRGVELRLGIETARELRSRRAREELAEFLAANELFVFSINAFPLLDFHARRVKEQVYRPSWAEAARPRWTNAIADIFADLLPAGLTGSISTSGGMYRREAHDPKAFRKLAQGYLRTVAHLADLEQRTGKTIVLAAEPEPETTFENARDVIEFFESYLWPAAKDAWGKDRRRRAKAEETLRRFFTVNVDTCHFSVLFESLPENLKQLRRAGIGIGKLHVTNAIRLRNPFRRPSGYADLRGMHEPRYFHQFCGVNERGRAVWRDLDLNLLPRRLDRDRHPNVVELRSHYHVPVYLKKWLRMETTQDETREAVVEVLKRRDTDHLVIETYTWPILTSEDKLVRGICREFRWLLDVLDSTGRTRSPRRR